MTSPWRQPAGVGAALVAAAAILTSVSFRMFDPDLWQHLLVGKVIWQMHAVPSIHLWTWPGYGAKDVLQSWLFCALVWPLWSVGGVWGLFVWRWLITLVTFGLLWAVSYRIGARGFVPLLVLVVGALVYRQRAHIRPETLAMVLMAGQLWILETRRKGGADHSRWLIPIGCVWINAHLSYFLGLVITAVFWLGDLLQRQPRRNQGARSRDRRADLGWILGATALVSFLNPFGWRAVWQPFEYVLFSRHELIYQNIRELQGIDWSFHVWDGLPLMMAGWPLLALIRSWRGKTDLVELILCALFTTLIFFGPHFIGFYVVTAVPYLARDLDEWFARRRTAARLPIAARAAWTAIACIVVGIPEWTSPRWPLGVAFSPRWYPEAACDFMQAHGVRGRGFNHFEFGGYMLFRFWPDRSRLPFMDIHQSGTPRDRDAYALSGIDPTAWADLDGRHRFDYALVSNRGVGRLVDFLDADTSFALVFVDDVAALYVRRQGEMAPIAARFAYRLLPAGPARLMRLDPVLRQDSLLYDRLWEEGERAVASSGRNGKAHNLLANMALVRGRWSEARPHLEKVLEIDARAPEAHLRLGWIDLEEHRFREALRELRRERSSEGSHPELDLWMGKVYRQMGDTKAAERWYRSQLKRDPGDAEATDSLAAIAREP